MSEAVTTTEGEKPAEVSAPELGDAGKRALEAERRARAAAEKRAKEAEAKVQAAEDADKSEVEKLQAQVASLTKSNEAATARADRFEVAAAAGLSLAQARRLVGTTKEELEADAEEMRSELGLSDPEEKKSTGGRPVEDLRSGASNTEDEEPDAKKLADEILSSGW